jgi:hypothetical protein
MQGNADLAVHADLIGTVKCRSNGVSLASQVTLIEPRRMLGLQEKQKPSGKREQVESHELAPVNLNKRRSGQHWKR